MAPLRQGCICLSSLGRVWNKTEPIATVVLRWQAVGGRADELCQWQPLKRTTHPPVTSKTWWMIISRCDRCWNGGGSLSFLSLSLHLPHCLSLSLPIHSLSLSSSSPSRYIPLFLATFLSLSLGQGFNTIVTSVYWHTSDSGSWLMSVWVLLSLSISLPACSSSMCYPPLSLSEEPSQAYITHWPLEPTRRELPHTIFQKIHYNPQTVLHTASAEHSHSQFTSIHSISYQSQSTKGIGY